MRFEALALERYGTFTGRELRFADGARVHVVHGANEAGKTSALAAITDFLFGFGHTTPYGFRHDQNLLRIGATLRLGDGSALSVRRRKGRGITVLDASDRTLGDDPLAARMGAIDRQTFAAEFGLTATMLRHGGAELMKAGGKLAESLAASSTGLSALARLRASLEADADTLFRPTRTASKDFYIAYDRHKSADQRLRESVVTVDAWKAANRAAAEASEAHRVLQQKEARLRADLARRERARRTRPKLSAIAVDRADLAAYADLPRVAGDAPAQWQRAVEDEVRIREQLVEIDAADARDGALVTALAVDEAILSADGAIQALVKRVGEVKKARADLPRRIVARREALDALARASRRVGFASAETLLAEQPTDLAVARVRALAAEGRRATERCREADKALSDARAEHRRLTDDEERAAPLADPSVLKRRLDVFADVPVDADRLRRERAAIDRATRKLTEEAASLAPATGPLEALASRPLPAPGDILRAKAKAEAMALDLRDKAAEVAAAAGEIRLAEREIAKLESRGGIVTWSDLRAARRSRDDAWATLGRDLDGPAPDRRARFEAAGTAIRAADEVVDRVLADVDRAVRSAAAQERKQEAQARHAIAAQARDAAIAAGETAEAAWQSMWTGTGVVPLDPVRMQAWRESLAKLLDTRDALAARESEAAALADKLEACRPGLMGLAQEVGTTPPAAAPLEHVFREIAAAVEALRTAWTQARERTVAAKASARSLAQAEVALERARRDDEAWRGEWPAAIGAIGLPAEAGFAEVDVALEVWQGVPAEKRALDIEGQRVSSIERDLRQFESDVGALVGRVAADLSDRAPDDALDMMEQRLVAARRAHQERSHLQTAVTGRQPKRAELSGKLDHTAALLAQARHQLDLADDIALAPVLERLAAKARLEGDGRQLLAALREAADGLDEAALLAEQADLDLPGLDASIVELGERLTRLAHEEIGAARAEMEQAKAAVQALAAGRDAEAAACDKEEAAAEIRDIAERWMVRAAAAKLAALAIDRHRASVQDPVVARASELFAIVTGGAFAGLTTQYEDDKDTPILVGRRADESTVKVEGMSEGTRDQLYLVLRLALLERHTLEPLPFIGDDLLASFDEARTAHTLDVLSAFGEKRQVILFTHHAHVAGIARARLGELADLIAL